MIFQKFIRFVMKKKTHTHNGNIENIKLFDSNNWFRSEYKCETSNNSNEHCLLNLLWLAPFLLNTDIKTMIDDN